MFRDLTDHFLHMLEDNEQFLYDDDRGTQKQLHQAAYTYRLKQFPKTHQYQVWQRARQELLQTNAFRERYTEMRRHVRTLQLISNGQSTLHIRRKLVTPNDLFTIYHFFQSHVHTRDEVLEFLSLLPESRGGIFPLAVGLMHSDERIRQATVELMQRMDGHPEGNKAVSSLNYYLLMTYYRYVKQTGRQIQEYSSEDEIFQQINLSGDADDDEDDEEDDFSPALGDLNNRLVFDSPSSVAYPPRFGGDLPTPTSEANLSTTHEIAFLQTPSTTHPTPNALRTGNGMDGAYPSNAMPPIPIEDADDGPTGEPLNQTLDKLDEDMTFMRIRAPTFHPDEDE